MVNDGEADNSENNELQLNDHPDINEPNPDDPGGIECSFHCSSITLIFCFSFPLKHLTVPQDLEFFVIPLLPNFAPRFLLEGSTMQIHLSMIIDQ